VPDSLVRFFGGGVHGMVIDCFREYDMICPGLDYMIGDVVMGGMGRPSSLARSMVDEMI
jgi:hypothetical protein